MTVKELQEKSPEQLHLLLRESREKLRVLRFQIHEQQLKNVREIRLVRHDIARILTVMMQREKTEVKKSEKVTQ